MRLHSIGLGRVLGFNVKSRSFCKVKLKQDSVELKNGSAQERKKSCRVKRQSTMMKIFANYINDKE